MYGVYLVRRKAAKDKGLAVKISTCYNPFGSGDLSTNQGVHLTSRFCRYCDPAPVALFVNRPLRSKPL